MRLINIHTLRLEEFLPGKIPRYVILSHTWGDEEPTLQEWMNQQATTKQGGAKILQLIQVIKKGRGAQPSRCKLPMSEPKHSSLLTEHCSGQAISRLCMG